VSYFPVFRDITKQILTVILGPSAIGHTVHKFFSVYLSLGAFCLQTFYCVVNNCHVLFLSIKTVP